MIAGILFCAGCAAYKQPAPPATSARSDALRIVVLPVHNLSGKPAPLQEIRQALIQEVAGQGAAVPDDADLEKFLALHRVRYVGGIDEKTAKAFREETGVEAVLITTLEQYTSLGIPKMALSSRLVSTDDIPRILWTEHVAYAGDESPGLFGLGRIGDIHSLQKKVLDRLTSALAKFFSDNGALRKAGGGWWYNPKLSYLSRFMAPGRTYTIAVIPFFNQSAANNADEIIMLHFVRALSKFGDFEVVEPGMVRQRLLSYRLIMRYGPSLSDTDLLFNGLEADFILTGKVLDYADAPGGIPQVEFSAWVYERESRKMVWVSRSYNGGSDGVFFFDWGKASTVGVLASKMVGAVVRKMAEKDPRLPQEQIFKSGPFSFLSYSE